MAVRNYFSLIKCQGGELPLRMLSSMNYSELRMYYGCIHIIFFLIFFRKKVHDIETTRKNEILLQPRIEDPIKVY